MRLPLIALGALAALALALPSLSSGVSAAGTVQVVAWASKTTKNAIPPRDAVKRGVYCKPVAFRRLYAFITFRGMRDTVASSATWYYNDKRVFVFPFKWEDGASGRTAFEIHRQKGLLEQGRYKIEVRSGGRLAGSGAIRLKFGSC